MKERPEVTEREDLLRQARGVFGVDCTMQLFGTGGRIVAEDGRKLTFDSMEQLRELVDREQREEAPSVSEPAWCVEGSMAR